MHRKTSKSKRRVAVMADVAKVAGVSHQTVSRVLHESPLVRRETRERVLAAIRQLDYRPSSVAQALVTGRTRTLGVVSFDPAFHGPAATLLGIEEAAQEKGYGVIVANVKTINRESIMGAVARLRGHCADGVVIVAPQVATADGLSQLSSDVALVAAGSGGSDLLPAVAVDQHAGAALATQHLLDLGHRNVWHVAGPEDWLESQLRIDGWRATLKAAGIAPPPVLIGDWSPRSGYQLGRRLLATPGVTAVFVANDQMALGLLRLVREMGLECPRDLSVVGFDDIPEAAFFVPPLTTVRQDFVEVGRQSLHLLLEQLESGVRSPVLAVIGAELVVRESASAPPERARSEVESSVSAELRVQADPV